MPVILNWEGEEEWLDPRATTEELQSLLVPFASHQMEVHPVSLFVNNAKNQGRRCIEPAVA
jgi:putative SOS response-associated peptidase YedK